MILTNGVRGSITIRTALQCQTSWGECGITEYFPIDKTRRNQAEQRRMDGVERARGSQGQLPNSRDKWRVSAKQNVADATHLVWAYTVLPNRRNRATIVHTNTEIRGCNKRTRGWAIPQRRGHSRRLPGSYVRINVRRRTSRVANNPIPGE